MPVRDLTFRVSGVLRELQENATHYDEICGGNALNAAIGIVRLGERFLDLRPDGRRPANVPAGLHLRKNGA